jgi:hypothetical protein
MADVQLDDKSDITLSNITDKIKKADQTAKEMYTRLDRFMESSARKEKNAKDEASLSKSKETKSNDQAQRDPVTKQEAPEAIKDTNTDELVNSVMGEVSDQLGKANLQADTLEIQEDLNTKTILNAVSDQNKQTLPPVVQGEVEMSESKEPQQSAEQTVPSKANAAGPIEINVIADTKQSIKTDKTEPPQNVETGEPLATPNIIEPIEPLVTTTAPVATNSPEKTKLDMPEVSQTPIAKAPPVQESSVATLPEVFEPQVPEMSPASNVVEDFIKAPQDAAPDISMPEAVVAPPIEAAETIDAPEPTLPEVFEPQVPEMSPASNVVEDFIKAPQDAAPDISMPEAVEAPAEPFVASKGSASPQEFPNIIASTQAADQGSSMNLADESLVTIEKSLDNMSQQMKQNQEKLVSSLSNLNNTAMEILKILPTLQQRGSDQPMKVSSNSQTHSIDASNMIGNFRDSLNLTTKGYSRNTVFPGNNSIT